MLIAAALSLATAQIEAGPSGEIPAPNAGAAAPSAIESPSGNGVAQPDSALDEATLARRAKFTNAMDDYRRYIHDFPDGPSAKGFNAIVDARQAELAKLRAHPTKPLQRAEYVVTMRDVFAGVDVKALRQIAPTGDSVRLRWELAEDGQVENCRIVVSSGSDKLDWLTCALVTKYLKARPARGEQGLPVRVPDLRTIIWPH